MLDIAGQICISTSSEASTLQLSLLALDIKQGDYVVTAPASFVRLCKPDIKLHLAAFLITPSGCSVGKLSSKIMRAVWTKG